MDEMETRLARWLRDRDQKQAHADLDEHMGVEQGCGGIGRPDPCGGCIDCLHAQIAYGFTTRWDEYVALAREALGAS